MSCEELKFSNHKSTAITNNMVVLQRGSSVSSFIDMATIHSDQLSDSYRKAASIVNRKEDEERK